MLFATLKVFPRFMNFAHPLNFKLVRYMGKVVVDKNKALVLYHKDKGIISITLKYINEDLNINKGFRFDRRCTESCSFALHRISEKINDYIIQKCLKKKLSPSLITASVISKVDDNNVIETESLSCLDSFLDNNNYLKIGNEEYHLEVNPPRINALELPKNVILAGFMLYPSQLDAFNINICDSDFKWYVSRRKFESVIECDFKMLSTCPQEWKEIGKGFHILTNEDHISRLIKVVVVPGNEDVKGREVQAISSCLVSEIGEPCLFENRHQYTPHVLAKEFVRVVTYNILANMYASSYLAKTVLFRNCPPIARDIEYRKQLILKELIGYNADVICLQEVEYVFFHNDLKHILPHYNLEGVLCQKRQNKGEGVATFYNQEKFDLLEEKCFTLSEELRTNLLFSELFETLKENEVFYETFSKQETILQVLKLARRDSPEKIVIVGNTHLYAKLNADLIRLLQASLSLRLLKDEIDSHESQNPDAQVSLLFCGDLNSLPDSSVYQLATAQSINFEDKIWDNYPETKIKNISLSHGIELTSAYGTPPFTNYTMDFNGCLDYIFYQRENFTVDQTVPLPSEEELEKYDGLPSRVSPSDHIALVADLRWKC